MNPEILGRLDRQTRGKDLRSSNLQTTLTKVGNITAKTTDMLLKARSGDGKVDVDNMVRMNTDALALLGHISFKISQRRRDAIRPTLHKDYAIFKAILSSLLKYFQGERKTIKAGSLAAYSHLWQEITSDPEALETVTSQYCNEIRTLRWLDSQVHI